MKSLTSDDHMAELHVHTDHDTPPTNGHDDDHDMVSACLPHVVQPGTVQDACAQGWQQFLRLM
jgi:hypothetical protein